MVRRTKHGVTRPCSFVKERILFMSILTFVTLQLLIINVFYPPNIYIKTNITISRMHGVSGRDSGDDISDNVGHTPGTQNVIFGAGLVGGSPNRDVLRAGLNIVSNRGSGLLASNDGVLLKHIGVRKRKRYQVIGIPVSSNFQTNRKGNESTYFNNRMPEKSEHELNHGIVTKLVLGSSVCELPLLTLTVIILVTSAPSHVKERSAIRNTWGRSNEGGGGFRYVFVIGVNSDGKLDGSIKAESETHGDVIVGDFIDSYYNLTYKTLFGFRWTGRYCKIARFIMKTDDDVYLNIPNLIKFLRKNETLLNTGIAGFAMKLERPNRTEESKWYISAEEYPGDSFPPFCSGIGYITSRIIVQNVLSIAEQTPIFHLEDVYIGTCVHRLGLTIHNIDGFYQKRVPSVPCLYKGPDTILIHNVTSELLRKIWKVSCDTTFLHSRMYKELLNKTLVNGLLV